MRCPLDARRRPGARSPAAGRGAACGSATSSCAAAGWPQRTVYLDNRQMDARVGFYVMTPLQLQGRRQMRCWCSAAGRRATSADRTLNARAAHAGGHASDSARPHRPVARTGCTSSGGNRHGGDPAKSRLAAIRATESPALALRYAAIVGAASTDHPRRLPQRWPAARLAGAPRVAASTMATRSSGSRSACLIGRSLCLVPTRPTPPARPDSPPSALNRDETDSA